MPKVNSFALEKYLRPDHLRCQFDSSKKILLISLFTAKQKFTFLLREPFLLRQE